VGDARGHRPDCRRRIRCGGFWSRDELRPKIAEADDQREGRSGEQNADDEVQIDLEQNVNEQCRDHHADEEHRESGCRDGGTCKMASALETLDFVRGFIIRPAANPGFGHLTSPIDDARKPTGHDAQGTGNSREQEDSSERQLNGMADIFQRKVVN